MTRSHTQALAETMQLKVTTKRRIERRIGVAPVSIRKEPLHSWVTVTAVLHKTGSSEVRDRRDACPTTWFRPELTVPRASRLSLPSGYPIVRTCGTFTNSFDPRSERRAVDNKPSALKVFLERWLISTLAVLVAAQIVHGIDYDTNTDLFVASLLLGILTTFLRPLLMLISLPLLILTLGLFMDL